MFRTRKAVEPRAAQRVAEDAWERLVSVAESLADTARAAQRRTYEMADGAGSSMTSATSEARRRAGAAVDALAGRRSRIHWEWVAGAMVAGLVVGWFAATSARRTVGSAEHADLDAPADLLDTAPTTGR